MVRVLAACVWMVRVRMVRCGWCGADGAVRMVRVRMVRGSIAMSTYAGNDGECRGQCQTPVTKFTYGR